jgi:hypothetical protein
LGHPAALAVTTNANARRYGEALRRLKHVDLWELCGEILGGCPGETQLQVRAMLAIVEVLAAGDSVEIPPPATALLEAVHVWADCPCQEHEAVAGERYRAAPEGFWLAPGAMLDGSPDVAAVSLAEALEVRPGLGPHLYESVRVALVPWVLGYGDPLEGRSSR